MASSSSYIYHTRSNSLPSKTHPVTSQVEEHLCRLRSSEATSTSITQKINTLQHLHDSVSKFAELPQTQQTLSQEQNSKWVNELLDGSTRLLDVCTIAKDALSQTNESLREVQSAIRRKRAGETGFTSEVKTYLASRKSLKKAFLKVSKSMKSSDNNFIKNETFTILREAEAVTVDVLASILSFISGSNAQSKMNSKWSLVSKLMSQKRVACEEHQAHSNEFAKVDAAMLSLMSGKSDTKTASIQSHLQSLESSIQDLEEGLDCLFRCLIKARVSLLK